MEAIELPQTVDRTLPAALAALAAGKPVLLIDEDRDRGDFVAVAELVSTQAINLMATWGRGLVAVAIAREHRERLELPTMTESGALASVEASRGIDTGISAADRALTIRTVADPRAKPSDVVSPGHIVPVLGAEEGLLYGGGRVEAAIEIARLAAWSPAAAICEVLDDDGDLADARYVRNLGSQLGVPVTTIATLIESTTPNERTQ
jgi:3,4-dihydroxy 2-butanone 4-phosphate synthase / GTP cyclohydrolase II